MKKRLLVVLLALVVAVGLVACSNDQDQTQTEPADRQEDTGEQVTEETTDETSEDQTQESSSTGELEDVTIGVTPVPHGEIVEGLRDEFEQAGINIEVVEFTDYVQPNLALQDGDLDLNYFQHEPYFDNFKEEHELDLVSLGFVHIEPMGVFSATYDSLDQIEDGATVFIPNDPTNGGRALLLLEDQGLITLEDSQNLEATEADIVDNPKNLQFTALEAVSVAATYEDADLAVINSNYALDNGLDMVTDSLAVEDVESPYANLVAVRMGEETNELYQRVFEILQSDKAREFIEDNYQGAVFPAF